MNSSVGVCGHRKQMGYHAGIDCQPALVFVLLDHLLEELFVDWVTHLLVDPALVAGHVVWLDGHAQGVCRVHPVHVHIHCQLKLAIL